MREPELSASSQSGALTGYAARPLMSEKKAVASFEGILRPSAPVRVAIIGNHLPRQCGIATFTTDLCDALALGYGAAGISVVAMNDSSSPHSYPMRVRFQIAEGDLSSYRAD
jgi:hypothetical protein